MLSVAKYFLAARVFIPPTPFQGKHTNPWAIFSFWMYIHIYTKFKVVYAAHQSKTRKKAAELHKMPWGEAPEGTRCALQNSVLSLVLQTPAHAIWFLICEGICNVYRHTCMHTHRFVCLHIRSERRRETYKLLTAAYSRNSFCLMALLGFLIVMTNWLPSNAEMGKASWSYRRNMRTYLTMCKGTQGLFYFFFFFIFFFFLGEKTGKEAWSETI